MGSNTNPMEPVRLYNGDVVPRASVAVIFMSLENLMKSDPIAFYELVMISRDRSHKIFSSRQEETLRGLALLEGNGQPHDLTRSIVCSAVKGELLEMRLVWPIDPDGAPISSEEGWESPDPTQFLQGDIPDDGNLGEN